MEQVMTTWRSASCWLVHSKCSTLKEKATLMQQILLALFAGRPALSACGRSVSKGMLFSAHLPWEKDGQSTLLSMIALNQLATLTRNHQAVHGSASTSKDGACLSAIAFGGDYAAPSASGWGSR